MEHTTKAAEGSYSRQSQQTYQPYLGQLPPFLHSWRVLSNIGKWAIVRQGEPTIVVSVSQNIARVHGTQHKGSRRQLQPPITTNISAIPRPTAPFSSFLESVVKHWQMGHCETRRANHCCGSVPKHC